MKDPIMISVERYPSDFDIISLRPKTCDLLVLLSLVQCICFCEDIIVSLKPHKT